MCATVCMQAALEAESCGLKFESLDEQGLLSTAKRVWLAEVCDRTRKSSSFYARDITSVVIGLGQKHIEEDTSSGYAVDVSLPTLRIAIEADGPTHRCRNSKQPLGSTVMKQRHLKSAGWQLITVPHDDWDALRTRQQKLQYLHTRILACSSC